MFGGGGPSFGSSASAGPTKAQAVGKVSGWLEQLLPEEERADWLPGGKAADGSETSVIVNQLECQETGCPDVELVITLLRPKPLPKLMFKIFKAAADLTEDEVKKALEEAMAKEASASSDGAGDCWYVPERARAGHCAHRRLPSLAPAQRRMLGGLTSRATKTNLRCG